jgi:hypothetical protein
VNDLKINFPDTCVSLLLVLLSFVAVCVLGMLQVMQAIWGRKISGRIEGDPDWSVGQYTSCTVHERQAKSKSWLG